MGACICQNSSKYLKRVHIIVWELYFNKVDFLNKDSQMKVDSEVPKVLGPKYTGRKIKN